MQLIFLLMCSFIPIIGLIVTLFLYIFNHKSKGITYSIILALFFGLLAYHFIPLKVYDLYRHHQLVQQFMIDSSLTKLIAIIKNSDLEILPILISYLISFTNNKDLLQMIIVTTGYFILFYMMYDYRKKINISNLYFVLIVANIIFGFYLLYFISGLYFYVGIIIFALGFYLDYQKGQRYLPWLCYLISLLFHNSILFPLFILIIYKACKSKFSIKCLLVIILIIIFPKYILEVLSNITNLKLFSNTLYMYNTYLLHNNHMFTHYHGTMFTVEIIKTVLITLISFYYLYKKEESKTNGYIVILLISTLLSMTMSIVMIRFIMLIQFISIPLFLKFNLNKNKNKIFLIIMLLLATIFYFSFFIKTISNQNFGNYFTDRLFQPIFEILKK